MEAVSTVLGSQRPRWPWPQPPLLPVPLGILCAEPLEVAGLAEPLEVAGLAPPLAPSRPRAGGAASLGKRSGEEVSVVLECGSCPLLPVPLPAAGGSHGRAGDLPRRCDISIPTALLYPAQHVPVAVCWSCLWFQGR